MGTQVGWGRAEPVRQACREIHSPSQSGKPLGGLGSEQRHPWPLQRVCSWGSGGSSLVGGQLLGQEGSSSGATAMKGAQVIYREPSYKYPAPQPSAPMGWGQVKRRRRNDQALWALTPDMLKARVGR